MGAGKTSGSQGLLANQQILERWKNSNTSKQHPPQNNSLEIGDLTLNRLKPIEFTMQGFQCWILIANALDILFPILAHFGDFLEFLD